MRRVPSSLIQTLLKLIESSIYWVQNHEQLSLALKGTRHTPRKPSLAPTTSKASKIRPLTTMRTTKPV